MTGPDTDLTLPDSPSRMPPPPDRIHRRRERGADPIMPVLEVRPSEPDVRICQRNVLIDQAQGWRGYDGIPAAMPVGGTEPDGAHMRTRLAGLGRRR